MITRLEVDGFKSLRDFAVDLEPFTVLVGPNSAGKSNILDALALLSRLASQPVEEAFKQGRGRSLDQFTRRGGEPGTTIRFAVEVFIHGLDVEAADGKVPNRYRYEIVLERRVRGSRAEQILVQHESLRALSRSEDRWLEARPQLADCMHHADEGHDILKQTRALARERLVMIADELKDEPYRAPITHTALAALRNNIGSYVMKLDLDADDHVRIEELKKLLGLRSTAEVFRLLQLDAARLREPSERIGAGTLASDASNLPTVLADLSPPVLGEIRADLVSLVPGISSFEVVPEGDSFRIDFEVSGGERLPARLVSDGTLRLLALLTALRVEPHPSMVAIEEPENGVYPGRLQRLFGFLREATREPGPELPGEPDAEETDTVAAGQPRRAAPPQILLTSHSPVVLTALRATPQHLRFIDLVRRDGQLVTRARTVAQSAGPDRGRTTISLREIDALLHTAESEAAE